MSFLFFLFALLSCCLTYNVFRPIQHHPKLIVPSFIAGWLAGELAIHVIVFQMFVVFLFIWGGALDHLFDAFSFALLCASWLHLAYHYYTGYKAKVLMDSIVIPSRQDTEHSNWSRHEPNNLNRLMFPRSAWRDDEVEEIKNIVFSEEDGIELKLDIRRSIHKVSNAPVLFQIHGGAWTHGYGSKEEQGLPLVTEMAKRGWVCVSITYRKAPRFKFPLQIVDCKKALVWVKEHIESYGGDPSFIVATGGSAGGHLSSLLALTPNLSDLQPGFEAADTSVQGCVPFYGIYDLLDEQSLQLSPGLSIILRKSIIGKTKEEDPELYRLMSPVSHIDEQSPPFLVIHGDKDSLTSLPEAQYFASQLDLRSKQSVEFAEIAGAQHAFDIFPSLRSDYVMSGVADRIEQWHRDAQ